MNNSVRHYMRSIAEKNVTRIHCDTPILEVIKILEEHHLSGAPVVDQEQRLIGFISEYDCLKTLLKTSYHCDQPALACDVMNHQLVTVAPSDSVVDLAIAMLDKKPEMYPVVEGDKLVGVIARQDVLHALMDNQARCNLHA